MKMKLILLLTLVTLASCVQYKKSQSFDIKAWFQSAGYDVKIYPVQTTDGYILPLFRVPGGLTDQNHGANKTGKRPPILLMHSMMSSGLDFAYGGDQSLLLNLVHNGFDVFLGNVRGSRFGMQHTTLNPDKDPSFWNFSFDEIGTKDLPAIIDKILELTGQEKLNYIGHLEGTMVFYIMLAELPQYTNKFDLMISFGAMAFMQNSPNKVLRKIIESHSSQEWIIKNLGQNMFNPSEEFLSEFKIDCQNSGSRYKELICDNYYFLIKGYDSVNLNTVSIILSAINYKLKTIEKLKQDYDKIWSNIDYKMYEKVIKYTNYMLIFYTVLTFLTSFAFLPIEGYEDSFFIIEFIATLKLPEKINLILKIIQYTFAIYLIICSLSPLYLLIFGTVTMILKLKICKHHFINISKDFKLNYNCYYNEKYQKKIRERLIKIIDNHIELKNSLKVLIDIVEYPFLIFYGLGVLCMVFTIYFKTLTNIKIIAMFILIISVEGLYFVHGQAITNESMELHKEAMNCPWYLWNKDNRRTLQLFLIYSSDPMKIHCKGFIELSYSMLLQTTVNWAIKTVPFGGSVNQLLHLAQMAESGRFQTFSPNWSGTVKTREYDLSKVEAPIAVFYTFNDTLSDLTDVQTLVERLPRIALNISFSRLTNSIDFLYSPHVANNVYSFAILFLKYGPYNETIDMSSSINSWKNDGLHPNTGLNMTQLVTKYDYPIETHEIQTEDGYILTVFRIPHGRRETKSKQTNKYPIMLMHGLLSSSADFVNTGPEKALGLILADAGYDVWMGNKRGNIHSRKHISLDIEKDKKKFFNYSFHEIGYYDLPATIDYILNATQQEKLIYIGVSQGTTGFFVMASERHEYNAKIRFMAALAPVAYMTNVKSPIARLAANNYEQIVEILDLLEIYEFLPYKHSYLENAIKYCNGSEPVPDSCTRVMFLMSGFDPEQWDPTIQPVISSNSPAGTAVGEPKHFLQLINSGRFRQYDYGPAMNMEKYGTGEPPVYNLMKVTAPVALYCGQNDWLSNITDVQQMVGGLSNVIINRVISYPKFNHLDFLYAIDVVELLYNDLLNDLKKLVSDN